MSLIAPVFAIHAVEQAATQADQHIIGLGVDALG